MINFVRHDNVIIALFKSLPVEICIEIICCLGLPLNSPGKRKRCGAKTKQEW